MTWPSIGKYRLNGWRALFIALVVLDAILFAVDAGVEDRDVDVLPLRRLPDLRDAELLEAPRQPILGFLAAETIEQMTLFRDEVMVRF